MVKVKPFAAVRPPKEIVTEVAARPYDVLNKPRRRPTLAQAIQALPLATQRLTAEFGMGSGRTTASRSPGKSVLVYRLFFGIHALKWKGKMFF